MKDAVKLIKVKEDIQADNDLLARRLRESLRERKTFLINLMSSPGAGKTSLLLQTTTHLRDTFQMAVIEADIDSSVDAERIADSGITAIQLQTDGFCHLDVPMVQQGLRNLDVDSLDLIFIENVGNLVCPAEFDTGAALDVMILSVPEGDDKPLKYPLMFSKCHALIINKTDYLETPLTDFDLELLEKRVRKLNKDIEIFPLSARTGAGIKAWNNWLSRKVSEHNS
ncbi:hydrogenase nickel incorporation protein HypB [Desulfopila sp. IMCC35008]|uniref:hydrogenase nickel incorporation protein HypB n=1 Tax=Desulfopila sp. IMCC35008 TaxID=2653858 RepID=UPI0013D3CAE0|nr:hydrogenase nickel incorporation protein HypB [Desulfopila sp. IMCC35008]